MELVIKQHDKEYQINEKRMSNCIDVDGSFYEQNLKERY